MRVVNGRGRAGTKTSLYTDSNLLNGRVFERWIFMHYNRTPVYSAVTSEGTGPRQRRTTTTPPHESSVRRTYYPVLLGKDTEAPTRLSTIRHRTTSA